MGGFALDMHYASIGELQAAYADGRLTVRAAVLGYLNRIARIDKGDGGLNAVLEVNPDALFIADALDARIEAGEKPCGLFGVPMLIKDNINTGDKMVTSAGSVALHDNIAPRDAALVARLRRAGAVILGKANMTEFANYMTRRGMPSGYSSRGGQVVNPHVRSETPSGSSSGSGVAVAAGLCGGAVGTETSGSIVHPALMNGIVGLKPTVGLVSRGGVIPISWTHDTAGPMARTVRDAALMLTAMAGYDKNDAATYPLRGRAPVDYAAHLGDGRLDGMRIGVNEAHMDEIDDFAPHAEALTAFDRLLDALRACGAQIVPVRGIGREKLIGQIMINEFKRGVDAYLAKSAGPTQMRSLADIVAYNRRNERSALRYGQTLLELALYGSSGTMTEPAYPEALARREEAIREADAAFDDAGVDVILCKAFTNAAPFTGFPCMSIPLGKRRDGLPIGSYWMARRFGEAALLRAAYAAEQALGLDMRPAL